MPLGATAEPSEIGPHAAVTSNTPEERYLEMVSRAKDYISAGDIFQVVLSQRFEGTVRSAPVCALPGLAPDQSLAVYVLSRFRRRFSVAGSSPEILVRVRDGEITIRPIAGTRPRGGTSAEDKALADELLADPKERAEHLMLLDLGRNDVGRVADIGSGRSHRQVFHRVLQPRHAHRVKRDRHAG